MTDHHGGLLSQTEPQGIVRILMQKLGVILLLYCWCLIARPIYAATQIQILTNHPDESAAMLVYLNKSLKEDVQISVTDTLKDKSDLVIVFAYDDIKNLTATRPPTLFVLPQPTDALIQKQDGVLYWTPSLAAQLALIKIIQPAVNKVGMLVNGQGEDSSWLRTFKQYAATQGVDVRIQNVDKSRIGRQVSDLAASTDILLAQPDSYIYNRETIRFILLAAYRQNRVLVGPSPAFVNAGSLASLYAAPNSIYEELVQQIHYFLKNNKLVPASRVKKLNVSLNPQVAKSLGLIVPEANEVEQKLHLEELPLWP